MMTYTDLPDIHGLRPKWTYKSLIDKLHKSSYKSAAP